MKIPEGISPSPLPATLFASHRQKKKSELHFPAAQVPGRPKDGLELMRLQAKAGNVPCKFFGPRVLVTETIKVIQSYFIIVSDFPLRFCNLPTPK